MAFFPPQYLSESMMKDFILALSAVNHLEIMNDKYPVKLQSCGLKHMHYKGFSDTANTIVFSHSGWKAEMIIRAA